MTIEYEVDNAQALNDLLEQIEKASTSAEFQSAHRDRGTRFETLSRQYFLHEPTYKDLFSKVQTFKEWAVDHPDLSANARDTGIDLVATLTDGSGFAAIQCKFYEKNKRVGKDEIDSFIAASSQRHFSQRYIIATNDKWTDNVRAELASVFPAVILITREQLAASQIDWSNFLKDDTVKIRKPRTPFPYQKEAIHNVVEGFKTSDRGKLIMACGTGKTFTSMKIVEEMEGENGFVMFLVPSLALLSQTLTDWKQQCAFPINAYAVCSDSTTGKAGLEEIDNLFKPSELNYPATTDAQTLAEKVNSSLAKGGLTVIFTTYQSIEVVSEAQKQYGMPEIGLAVCDEAHRTAGGYLVGNEEVKESAFLRVHNQDFIKSKKRLYMTATPKIFGKDARKREADREAVLYSMDDESVFGPVFHQISFRRAVELGSLVDYKVVVLTVEDNVFGDALTYDAVQNGGLSVSNAAKVVGCWRALSKRDLLNEPGIEGDKEAMKRAVGFAQVIDPKDGYDRVSSKQFAAQFQNTIENYKTRLHEELEKRDGVVDENSFEQEYGLMCETKHIDGSMDANEKGSLLNWLREDVDDNECKILFNVRCLSEGVDVPALDAVMFLSPRKSQVDVVQTVGRVMRRSPKTGKKRGYVIIPIVTPANVAADIVLNNNKDFDIVWQILRALRSIDPEFGAAVDGQLEKVNEDKIEVICLTEHLSKGKKGGSKRSRKPRGKGKGKTGQGDDPGRQGTLDFGRNEILEEELKARIVKKVGNVREWEEWAEEVGEICKTQITHINSILNDPAQTKASQAFDGFLKELKATINDSMNREEAVELIGQHIVTKPVMDALFEDYPFMDQNPISKALTEIVDVLDKKEMAASRKLLDDFYKAVKYRARNITTTQERQIVVRELFEKFFKYAFPKTQDKLGIVYTPEEVVDFINQSVADILQKEFGVSIADEGIHVLDPFTGTGTFLTRLMQSGLIPLDKLTHKFENELHASEIVPLAYYIASMNLETAYHDLMPETEYKPNNVTVWTDTFVAELTKDLFKTSLAENNARLARINEQDIRVIIGNPPYSVGQESQNDDNQNEHYDVLDRRLAETYVHRSTAGLKNSLYDSYIRAYRWASDRIGDRGVIGFVTNAGWLDSNAADGMRKCMAEEFSSIYVYHLKGNQRTVGEQSRKEGGKVFGSGSRAPVAIVILVKNPDAKEQGKIYFHAVDDYLTREEKLQQVINAKSIVNLDWQEIVPDVHGDWLNQRDDSFSKFINIGNAKKNDKRIFNLISWGVKSNRDAWVFNSSKASLRSNLQRMIKNYDEAVALVNEGVSVKVVRNQINTGISWTRCLLRRLEKMQKVVFSDEKLVKTIYRPFFAQSFYYDPSRALTEEPGKWVSYYPHSHAANHIIVVTGTGAKEFSCLMSNQIISFDFLEKSQCFPRYIYEESKPANGGLFDDETTGRKDGITPEAMVHFRAAYPGELIRVDDVFYYIYGILHSEDYRKKYANNLMKELPRIPRVATFAQFKAFSDAGRKLADLHVNYESVPEYEGVNIEMAPGASFRVSQMKWGKIPGKTGNAAKDKTRLIYNEDITIENIPLEAQEYVVNKRSALDWIVERACVSIDKASGIVNDFNDYAAEMGDSRYPLSLFLRVITVSVETMKIVKALPKLEIHPLDR